jgi:four helix bundle protein
LYGIVSQIRRAVVSVSLNIAEGQERRSKKEFSQFLSIARGSLSEVETLLMFASDLGYIRKNDFYRLEGRRGEVGKMLHGLMESIKP